MGILPFPRGAAKRKLGRAQVAELLADLAYSLQGHRQTKEGTAHPDRNAQFEYMNAQVAAFHKRGQPVVSVDTKKKELVGDCKNGAVHGARQATRSWCASMIVLTRRRAR